MCHLPLGGQELEAHEHTHTHIHSHIHTHTHAHTHVHIYTRAHLHTRTHTHTHTHEGEPALLHARISSACTHTCAVAHTCMHSHAHTHARTLPCLCKGWRRSGRSLSTFCSRARLCFWCIVLLVSSPCMLECFSVWLCLSGSAAWLAAALVCLPLLCACLGSVRAPHEHTCNH